MPIIETSRWLKEDGDQPVKLCKNLIPYFKQGNSEDIYKYLVSFGMYKPAILNRNEPIEKFLNSNHWSTVKKLYLELRKKWNGPDIPLFIFPVNERNARLMKENKGKAGLAFKDKLFLFLPGEIDELEIKALLVHEYHHVCRLKSISKKEKDMNLLDAIVLEGLAEYAVKLNCGEEYNANWTTNYSKVKLKDLWEKIILPNKNVNKESRQYIDLLYGGNGYPKMLGYCIGFYIINQCIKTSNMSFSSIEKLESEEIIKLLP